MSRLYYVTHALSNWSCIQWVYACISS